MRRCAFSVKVWDGRVFGEAPQGYARGTEDLLNTLRIGRLVIGWGFEGEDA